MTIHEFGVGFGVVGLVGGWIWNAASLAQQIRVLLTSVHGLHADLRDHIRDESETFEKIHIRLNDHHAGLARIEGRLHRNGMNT